MEHNPVYLAFFKYHNFTQIAPTKLSIFSQFVANPKSPKFLKLHFDVLDDFFAVNLILKKTFIWDDIGFFCD